MSAQSFQYSTEQPYSHFPTALEPEVYATEIASQEPIVSQIICDVCSEAFSLPHKLK